MLIPLLLTAIATYASLKQVDLYSALLKGASDGLQTMYKILPALITLLTAITMLRASGALDALAKLSAPLLSLFHIPEELAPLMFIRPFSGSGAIAILADLLETHGPDSKIGLIASVMLGSTETTFYTLGIYFGATSIRKTRYALPAALLTDLVGFLAATLAVHLLLL